MRYHNNHVFNCLWLTMKLKSIEISGLRSIANATLELGDFTVLIGENGSGKSSLLEAFEILRRCAESHFLKDLHAIHGGESALLTSGATSLTLAVKFDGTVSCFTYEIELLKKGDYLTIYKESLLEQFRDKRAARPLIRFTREGSFAQIYVPATKQPRGTVKVTGKLLRVNAEPGQTLLSQLSAHSPFILAPEADDLATESVSAALELKKHIENIQLHSALDTTAAWVARAIKRESAPLRQARLLSDSDRLSTTYDNLASVLFGLVQGSDNKVGRRLEEQLKLAFGERCKGLKFPPAGGGRVQLAAEFEGINRPITAELLSDGQLSYIALMAAFLDGENRSLLAIDEPELHLHPALLARMVSLAEIAAKKTQVVLATHSRGVLDALKNPATQAVLCALNHLGRTEFKRPDPESLKLWLQNYDGIGSLIADGYGNEVFK